MAVIETLSKLAQRCQASRISLEIPPSDHGDAKVLVVTTFGQSPRGLSKSDQKVLALLSQPLVLSGHVGELDQKLIALVDELGSTLVDAAKSLPDTNIDKKKNALKKATKKKSASLKGKKKVAKKKAKSLAEKLATGESESL